MKLAPKYKGQQQNGDRYENRSKHFWYGCSTYKRLLHGLGWAMIGGADVLEVMRRHKNQICSIHFKDFDKDVNYKKPLGKISAVGQGIIPLKEIVKETAQLNLYEDGFIIDQDWSQGDIFCDIENGIKNIRNAEINEKRR